MSAAAFPHWITAKAALALPAPTPDAWMLKTGHGVMFAVGKPSSEIDLWTPLYVEPPAPPEIWCACGDQITPESGAECGACITARAESPAPREPLTDEQIVAIRDECLPDQGDRLNCIAFARAILAAAPSEIARDAARIPREPTEAMLEAGLAASEPLDLDPICQPEELAAIYRAMYDTATRITEEP
jgi:hypothetical protein